VILIDSCVPMYLVGASHRHQLDAQRALEHLIGKRERLVTDAAVFEEIMHRYGVLDRRDAILPAFRALLDVVDEVLPIDQAVVEQAELMMVARPRMPARAGVHAAVMRVHGITKILSFDQSFHRMPGVTWLPGGPAQASSPPNAMPTVLKPLST